MYPDVPLSPFLYSKTIRLVFHEAGICFCLQQCLKNKKSSLWKRGGIFFRIELGILSCHGALLFSRFLRQKSYISWSKYVCRGIWGSPRWSIMNPSRSCHGYCLTPHVQYGG